MSKPLEVVGVIGLVTGLEVEGVIVLVTWLEFGDSLGTGDSFVRFFLRNPSVGI